MPPLDLGSLLQKYLDAGNANDAPAEAGNHFEQVAQQASPQVVARVSPTRCAPTGRRRSGRW
jgi:hypothetical protein